MQLIFSNAKIRTAKNAIIMLAALLPFGGLFSCNKLLDSTPKYIQTSSTIFSNNDSANFALSGLYQQMVSNNAAEGAAIFPMDLSMFPSYSSDEAIPASGLAFSYTDYASGYPADIPDMYKNAIRPGSEYAPSKNFWSVLYNLIYISNSIIEGINGSKGMTAPYKNTYLGEALFWRAYYYYFLVNLYGKVPLITSTDYLKNEYIGRTGTDSIYTSIKSDLQNADSLMTDDVNVNNADRVGRNAVRALLARVCLFTSDWNGAEQYADDVINSGKYSLAPIDKVFFRGSSETILTLSEAPYNYSSIAQEILPSDGTPALFAVTDSGVNNLVGTFEKRDKRLGNYVFHTLNTDGSTDSIYIDFKYKMDGSISFGTLHSESTVILRLAEQYLIRAEARNRLGKYADAIADLNIIRRRANASLLTPVNNETEIINNIIRERRLELCFEWGDRWFTLKRLNSIDSIMTAAKPNYWKPYAALYPIPTLEIRNNRYLTQNPGYGSE